MSFRTTHIAFAVILLSALAVPSPTYAQEHDDASDGGKVEASFGLSLVGSRNFHSGGFRTAPGDHCPLFEDGSAWGYGIGLSTAVTLVPDLGAGVIAHATFEQRPASLAEPIMEKVLIPRPWGPAITNDTLGLFAADVSYSLLNVDLLGKIRVVSIGGLDINAFVGPSAQYVVGHNIRVTMQTGDTASADCFSQTTPVSKDSEDTWLLYDGSLFAPHDVRLSAKGGLECAVPMFGPAWNVSTGIAYDYGLTNVTSSENWNLTSILVHVDVRRSF